MKEIEENQRLLDRLERVERMLEKMEGCHEEQQMEPEVHLINYLATLPENKVQDIFSVLMPINDEESSFLFYKKFVNTVRSDNSVLPKRTVVFLLNALMSSYERVVEFNEQRKSIDDYLEMESDFCNDF